MRPPAGGRHLGLVALALVSAAGVGCQSLVMASPAAAAGLAWPPDNPRVRLEKVVTLDEMQGGAGRKLLRWLSGAPAADLNPYERPYAVAWDGDDLLVADPDARLIARIPPRGRARLSPRGAAGSPIGVAACAEGIVATDSREGRVALLSPQLRRRRWLMEGLSRPTGVACEGRRIFVVETGAHRVLVREADGSQWFIGGRGDAAGELNFPTAVAVAAGSLWVGDTLNFRVQRFDAVTGEVLGSFGQLGDAPGETPRLKGLAVDAAGHVWVSDALLDRVSIYSPGGDLLISLGRPGSDPGELAFPAGLAAHPEGRVVVVDSFNRRLQVFQLIQEAVQRP